MAVIKRKHALVVAACAAFASSAVPAEACKSKFLLKNRTGHDIAFNPANTVTSGKFNHRNSLPMWIGNEDGYEVISKNHGPWLTTRVTIVDPSIHSKSPAELTVHSSCSLFPFSHYVWEATESPWLKFTHVKIQYGAYSTKFEAFIEVKRDV